jgi:hypothetical protein
VSTETRDDHVAGSEVGVGWLSHRVLAGYDAWDALCAEPGRLRSLTAFPRLPAAVTNS